MSKNKIQLTPEINVDEILETMASTYKNEDVNTIDGVKIDFADEWIHLRKSNTEPIIRIYTEAKSQQAADDLAVRFINEIKAILNKQLELVKVNNIILLVYFLVLAVFLRKKVSYFKKNKVTNKGKFFVYWGWNRASYSDSDIRFKGSDYDFTLTDVTAQDTPSKFTFSNYFGIKNLTIPQTNFRIGYFFKENYTISIGVDHMKYVVDNDQFVEIDGNINTGNP